MGNLENKANGFFKRIRNSTARIGTIGMLSALALLAGCSQDLIQYRVRVQTKPPEEVTISIDDEIVSKTSKTGPVYAESDDMWPTSLFESTNSECKISLKANKYDAFFIMRHPQDLAGKDGIITLNPKDRSQHCLEARVTKWENGPSYDLLFEIPSELIKNLHKKYTEWGDEIPSETPKASIKDYIEPEKTKSLPLPAKEEPLDEQVKQLQLRKERDMLGKERDRLAWREFDKKGWFGPACLNLLVPGVGHFFYESYTLGTIHLGISLTTAIVGTARARYHPGRRGGEDQRNSFVIAGVIYGIHALECFFETIFVASDYNRAEFRKKYPRVYVGFDPNEKTAFVGINYKF